MGLKFTCLLVWLVYAIESFGAIKNDNNDVDVFVEDGFQYSVISECEVSVSAYDAITESKLVIPSTVEHNGVSYSVTRIENFHNQDAITEIVIPSSVTAVGWTAFKECASISKIVIEDSPETLTFETGGWGFNGEYHDIFTSGKLQVLYLGRKIKGRHPFGYNLTEATIGELVDTVQRSIFDSCYDLTKVTLAKGNKAIEEFAFGSCYALASIDFPSTLTAIGKGAFSGCYSLTSIAFPSGLMSIGDDAFWSCSMKKVVIPATVKYIGNAFNSSKIESFVIEDSDSPLLPIDYENGYYSLGLATNSAINKLYIGRNIPDNAFESATVNEVEIGGQVTEISGGCFLFAEGFESIEIPQGVSSIGFGAFRDTEITEITIPASVEKIGDAFYECKALKTVTIEDSHTTLVCEGSSIFFGCESLESLYIGRNFTPSSIFFLLTPTRLEFGTGITTVPEQAFRDIKALSKLVIPSNISELYSCFAGSLNVDTLVIEDSSAPLNSSCVIYVAKSLHYGRDMSPYITVYPDNDIRSITLGEGLTEIPDGFGSECMNITKIDIPESVKKIGIEAFSCSGLTELTIPSTVMSLGRNAFGGCPNMSKVCIEDSETALQSEDYLVFNMSSLYLGRNIEGGVFWETSEEEVEIGCMVTVLPDYMFVQNRQLKYVRGGENVVSIGNNSFSNCSELRSITFGDKLKSIGDWALNGCDNLETIEMAATTPPACGFQVLPYSTKAALYVPLGTKTAYESTAWVNCRVIIEKDYSDIEDIIANSNLPMAIYNLQGIYISDRIDTLPSGIYIIRQGSTTKKMVKE